MKKRIEYWDKNHMVECMGDSLAVPFEKFSSMFTDKDVLEIGPGGGRQFDIAFPLSGTYAVADISKGILSQDKYKDVKRYHISDIKKVLTKTPKFDIIHFWYVFHHVPSDEAKDFINFLWKHLKKGGKISFNTPVTDYPDSAYADDGILTTPWKITQVRKLLKDKFTIEHEDKVWENSTGYVIIAVRK